MSNIGKLISGFRVFKSTTLPQKKDVIRHLLAQGHKPSTMVISCVDLRISASEIFAASPGELYVINNIGGLVPKYDTAGVHGILSAIEYAVTELKVDNIVVLGHAKCDSMRMMMSDAFTASKNGLSESMKTWLSVAEAARTSVKDQLSEMDEEQQQESCGRESLVISLKNLLSYPYVSQRVKKGDLNIVAWHFDIESGDILAFDSETGFFEPIS